MKRDFKEIGFIEDYFSGVVKIKGLPHVGFHEVLVDEKGKEKALVIGFDEEFVEALLFEEDFDLSQPLFRSYQTFSLPKTNEYLGRILDGLARPLDGLSPVKGEKKVSVFREAPPVFKREPVKIPLITGIKVIDTCLPIGRGQRELIIGDRKIGKTTLALDTVLNQKNAKPPLFCVYVLIAQKKSQIEKIIKILKEYGAMQYTTIIASSSDDSFASQYLAPFVGCTIGEFFRDEGKDALLVYDDLTKHAKVWRDISLLLERPPGRESYPGDIFSLHAGLLERASKISSKYGGGSLSALPIVETQEGDITGYIPTNLISITDGQIYLERGLFQKGFLPAVNIGLSVSRVGSQAQPSPLKEVTKNLRLFLSWHRELQKLAQFETKISISAKRKIQRGELILEILKQKKHFLLSWQEEVVLFFSVEEGVFDDISKKDWKIFEEMLIEALRTKFFFIEKEIEKEGLSEKVKEKIKNFVKEFKKDFLKK